MSDEFVLKASDLEQLFQLLQADGHTIMGPTLHNEAIIYDTIKSIKDLPQGWSDEQEKGIYRLKKRSDNAFFAYASSPHSWKKFLQLPQKKIWEASKSEQGIAFKEVVDQSTPMAFIGVRSCDLHAIEIQDKIFVQSPYPNSSYKHRRENIFIVAINCTTPAKTCFCTSMNTGPKVKLAYDIAMTEIIDENEHYFIVQSGSEKGEALINKLPLTKPSEKNLKKEKEEIESAIQQMQNSPRAMDSSDLKDLLYRNFDSARWDTVADQCLSCANCTMACPTCFCTTVEDTTDLTGDHTERWERWDSCFTSDFSFVHGGSIRQSTRSRYRQWLTHKLATWNDQFGSSGCVGCGRCIAWCPVGIDITEEIGAIRRLEKEKNEIH